MIYTRLKPRWPLQTEFPGGFTLVETYRHSGADSPSRRYYLQHTCGNKRAWSGTAIQRHIDGAEPILCARCVPIDERRESVVTRMNGKPAPERVERERKRCIVCEGMGAACRTPALRCGCPMPAVRYDAPVLRRSEEVVW